MAEWKKLIVSGSDAHLSSVTASNGAIIDVSIQIPRFTTDPDPVLGGIYYNTDNDTIYQSDGTTWIPLNTRGFNFFNNF